ncbi:hypothetical protein HYDPIDRAFT_98720 [Hydnomerulius pinastri MD-312]|uniref:choline-phosphate cytidylyltransferase n=1 Tax=Hydnomerulius pinastri MD-312 TaxID=994086 RepID=A0A0C9WAD5_9AGAM|nr:hypothetical protein HYDPIDRAFT_98720 [Hydnomerulius pinastri MD-312]
MESPAELLHHHKKTLHSKRSFGKYPHHIDSPTYDARVEDNDPLTDDGGSAMSAPVSARASRAPNAPHGPKSSSRARHQLASSMLSDDGADSQTYDGDIESSATAGAGQHQSSKGFLYPNLHHASSTSTLTSQIDDGVPSPSTSQQLAPPMTAKPVVVLSEPAPTDDAAAAFDPAALTPEDIRAFVKRAIAGEPGRTYQINPPPTDRPVRVFADGVYDLFHFGHALQLRQAKLSFPNVHLLIGVNTDEDVHTHKARCVMSHPERCEAVRHCRWVDEVIPDCPWILDAAFLEKWKIDYVAHDEVPYVAEGHDDVYAFVKERGQFIPTRRTPGVSTSDLLERIVLGYRRRDFDKKLEKMGHAELKAEGSDYEDMSSRSQSPKLMAE